MPVVEGARVLFICPHCGHTELSPPAERFEHVVPQCHNHPIYTRKMVPNTCPLIEAAYRLGGHDAAIDVFFDKRRRGG